MTIVNIPNVGQVNFPDNMSQDAILAAIQNDILPNYAKQQAEPQGQVPVQAEATNEKPSILAGTKLGPEEPITPFNSPPSPMEMPVADISKKAKDWGLGETLLQSAKVGVPQLLQGISTTGFRANADIINKIDTVEQQLAKGKKNFTIEEDPLGVADMTAEQRAKFRTDTESALGNRAAGVAQRQAEIEAIPQNPIVQKVMKAGKEEGLSGFIDEFKKDPVNFVAAIGPSSLVSNAPGMVAAIPATIAGGPAAGAAVMGAGSFATDYPSTIISALAENGVDIKDPEALKAAAKDKELMDKVGKQAFAHASAVGAIDAISAGIASKVPLPKSVMKALENKPVARELTNIALQSPIQGTLGASGEALGQLAAGQQLDWGNIGAEFAGEFFGAPVEVAAVSAGRAKEVTGEKLNERAEIKAKAAEDAAYKTAMSNILASKGFVFNSPQEQQVVVDTLAGETEVGGDKESRFTSLFNRLKEFNAAKEEEVGALVDSIKQRFIGTTPPPTTPQPAPTQPPGPQVTSAAGTPITPVPLDTAVKATEAKAAAPIAATTPDIEEQAKAKSTELGIPLEDARKLVGAPPVAVSASTVNAINTGNPELDTIANTLKAKYNLSNDKAIKQAAEVVRQQNIINQGGQNGTQPSTGVVAGANQPSLPMPQNGLQPAGGVTTPQSAGLASPVGVTGQPGVRAETVQTNEPSALNLQASTAATTNLMAVLQGAADGFTISQQEYAQTGQSPTLKKVKSYLTKSLTPLLGPKKTKAYVNYLTEEGGLDSSDYGSNSEYFQDALKKMVPEQVAPTPTEAPTVVAQPQAIEQPAEVTPAPQATKGKRTGRPATVLTPEETAAKKATKAAQTKDWKATDKQIAAAKAILELPEPTREDFKTQDAYLDAGMRYRTDRNQALDTLHAMATGPQRAGKLGATAKEALAHPSISTQERTNLQQRIENRKRQGLAQVSKSMGKAKTYIGEKPIQYPIKVEPILREKINTLTETFKKWFGNSTIVTKNGKPKVMYHGTARNITKFKPKQANAIFLTEDPRFAEGFSYTSEDYMVKEMFDSLPLEEQLKVAQKAYEAAKNSSMSEMHKLAFKQNIDNKYMKDIFQGGDFGPRMYLNKEMLPYLDSNKNIIPVYVKAEKPFDYENPEHVKTVISRLTPEELNAILPDFSYDPQRIGKALEAGDWVHIEKAQIQAAIKRAGFDGFYVRESGHKNLGVYNSNQIKSVFNENPTESANISKANTKTNSASDVRYESFKTTQQALNHVFKHGTSFEKFLARRLEPFLKGVNLVIVQSAKNIKDIKVVGAEGRTLRDEFNGANGMFAAYKENGKEVRTIYLRSTKFGNANFQGTNNTVFLHEALHAAINARINEYLRLTKTGKPVPAKLAKAIEGLQKAMLNAQDAYTDKVLMGEPISRELQELFETTDAFEDLKEFVSYGLTTDAMQQFLMETKGEIVPNQPGVFRSLFNGFVNAVRDLFNMDDSHMSALQDLMVVSEGLLRYEIQAPIKEEISFAGKKKVKAKKLDQDTKKVMRSQNIHDVAEGFGGWVKEGHDFDALVDILKARYKGMTEDAIKAMLFNLRTSDIIRWMGNKIAGLKEIDEFTQKMAAMRTNMLEAYAAKADQLAKFIVTNKGSDKILGNAMHFARLKGVTPDAHATAIEAANNDPKVIELTKQIEDPATPANKISNLTGQRTRRKNDIQVVYDAWAQLGKIEGGHDMYKMVRQFYKDNFNLQRHYLDERIERMQELPGDAKDEKTPKGQLMAEIRKMQEKDAVQEYFPLMRHGPAWFRESGTDGGFILFDSPWQRELYATKRAKELGKPVEELFKDLTFSSGNDIASLRNTNQRESTMLKNMFEIIDKAELDETSAEDLKDSLYQTWLTTLPEASIRKQFMHAENVSGFSADIFRNFTESANRMASQTPRLKYADQMHTEITRARDSLAGNPDQAKLSLFIDTVGTRAVEQLNPPSPNQLASLATRYAYYMLLTGAASAAVQLVAVPVMIYPILGARYGYGRASLKFAAYSNILGSMGLNIKETPETVFGHHVPSITASVADSSRIKNSKTLSAAYQALKERGLFAFTENNLLSQRGRTPLNATLSGPKKALRMTTNIMSGLFSGAERVSREIGAMMAFEMHYDKTKNFEESIQKAIAAVQDNMGRYDAMERPELFKKLPVIAQFKMYAANMASFFIRHSYNSAKIVFKEDRKQAVESMKILTGVLMMGAMFHGLKGMPLYSTVGAIVEALSDLGEDDEEKRRRRAQNPLVYQNSDLRFRRFLEENFGPVTADMLYSGPISSITDINIGAKTSFDNLWFRGGKPAKTNQEAFNNFVMANIGPAVSGIIGQAGALDDFENGHIERGLEKMLPAFFKNPLVATRLAFEGAKTKAGDTIIKKEDVTAANIIAQAAGAAPTRLARQQELGYELKGEYVKANQERTKILQRMNDAILNKEFTGEKKDLQPVINQIREFNKRYPMDKVMIDGEAIDNTLNAALDARALTYKGVRIPTEDMLPYFVPVLKQGRQ